MDWKGRAWIGEAMCGADGRGLDWSGKGIIKIEESMENVYRHPEWKRLYDELVPQLEVGKVFDYDTIRELMGIDAQTGVGRRQFARCAREITKDHQFQFENVKGVGYRVVAASENAKRMHNRMGRAKRRLRDAAFIGIHTKLEELTAEQRAANADILAKVGNLTRMVTEQRREVRAVIVAAEPKRLPHPLRNEQPAVTQ